MQLNLRKPHRTDSSRLPLGIGLGGLAAAAAFIYWLEHERKFERRPEPKQELNPTGQRSLEIQDEPESTIGRKPAELGADAAEPGDRSSRWDSNEPP